MERSALLSHPPSSESDPVDSEPISAVQSHATVPPGTAEARGPETPESEQERPSRLNETPGVEGCVDMVHRRLARAC